MKIQIASDLHLEFLEKFPGYRVIEPADADVLVIAGDIHKGYKAIQTFADWPVPVVYVHGNHEMYNKTYDILLIQLQDAAMGTNVHFLENEELTLDGVRFLGCCLWTDYRLLGDSNKHQFVAMMQAQKDLPDHKLIFKEENVFTPWDALAIHKESREWLDKQLDAEGTKVVVTHHAPNVQSIHPRYAGGLLNAAFASDLTHLVARSDLWIHGHTHDCFDYEIDGTRVIANPRGYPTNRIEAKTPAELIFENEFFNPALVVEV